MMKNFHKYITSHKAKHIIIASLIIIMIAWIICSNLTIKISEYKIRDEKIPSSFDGFVIAQISDLHNAEFGRDNSVLIDKLNASNPDIIVFTGDTVDNFHTDIESALIFIEQAIKIAPCYYVTGNHEAWIGHVEFSELENKMISWGVVVLHGEGVLLEKEDEIIFLVGIDDPDYSYGFSKKLPELVNREHFTILLSHRPEYFDEYVSCGYDLVLSGHAHGGQFRLPFIGGILAPNQGWFPKYDSGAFTKENTTMIVSRGLGNSVVPIRINNPPELILIELNREG